jgi:hypothetical protein
MLSFSDTPALSLDIESVWRQGTTDARTLANLSRTTLQFDDHQEGDP